MDLLSKLAEQGIAYLLLTISLSSNVYLFKLLLNEKDKRITEAETVRDTILQPLATLQRTIDSITLLLQGIINNKSL